MQIQLAQNVRAVRLDGVGAQIQQIGNFLIALAFGDQLEDFAFAIGEQLKAVLFMFVA